MSESELRSKALHEVPPEWLVRDNLSPEEVAELTAEQRSQRKEYGLNQLASKVESAKVDPEIVKQNRELAESRSDRSGEYDEKVRKFEAIIYGTGMTEREIVAAAGAEAAKDILRSKEVMNAVSRHTKGLGLITDEQMDYYDQSIRTNDMSREPAVVFTRSFKPSEQAGLDNFFQDATIQELFRVVAEEQAIANEANRKNAQSRSAQLVDIKRRMDKEEWVQGADGGYSYNIKPGEVQLARDIQLSKKTKRVSGYHQPEMIEDSEKLRDDPEGYHDLEPLANRIAIVAHRVMDLANPNNPVQESTRQDFLRREIFVLSNLVGRYDEIAKTPKLKRWLNRLIQS